MIRFIETGFEEIVEAGNVRSGEVKDKLARIVYGVGFIGNEKLSISGGTNKKRAYTAWRNMLKRCYCDKFQEERPTYIGCTVCEEWHDFQNFARWFNENYPNDGVVYHLDKDLKFINNKEYSPDSCVFVPSAVNTFVTDRKASRGSYMIGVFFIEKSKKFQSNCRNPIAKKQEILGYFNTELDAHMAWRNKKYEHAINLANQQEREEVKISLLNWAQALKEFRVHPINS